MWNDKKRTRCTNDDTRRVLMFLQRTITIFQEFSEAIFREYGKTCCPFNRFRISKNSKDWHLLSESDVQSLQCAKKIIRSVNVTMTNRCKLRYIYLPPPPPLSLYSSDTPCTSPYMWHTFHRDHISMDWPHRKSTERVSRIIDKRFVMVRV